MINEFNQSSAEYPLGVSRPPLPVENLPTPEEVFKVRRLGWEEVLLYALGPAVIALGMALGSGEWLLGPLNAVQTGLRGLGWVIVISAVLQVLYNIELGRLTIATGESPIVAFGRIPPGALIWVPLGLLAIVAVFIWGNWAVSAGSLFFTILSGAVPGTGDEGVVRLLGILLLMITFVIVAFGRRISRTLELVNWGFILITLLSLVMVTITVVPANEIGEAAFQLFSPPAGGVQAIPADALGSIAGFTALAAGLNFIAIGYYRDKGYGMGFRVGGIAGLLSPRQQPVQPVGATFPDDVPNHEIWRRWFRLLQIDQWGVFFTGSLLGMLLPLVLIWYLSQLPGAPAPDAISISVFAAQQLSAQFGPILFGWSLVVGFAFLFSTQVMILELLTRNFTDAIYSYSPGIRILAGNDPRRIYLPVMVGFALLVSLLINMNLPSDVLVLSANLSNLAAMIFPLGLIYLNRRLPAPARSGIFSILVLLLNTVFFGFFFVNFLVMQFTGQPLLPF